VCFKLGLGCLMEMTLREGGVSAASLVLVLVCARQNSSARDGVAVWPRVSNTVRRIWTHPLNRNQFQRKAGYHLPLPWNSLATMTPQQRNSDQPCTRSSRRPLAVSLPFRNGRLSSPAAHSFPNHRKCRSRTLRQPGGAWGSNLC
jgi:hypothetical protein